MREHLTRDQRPFLHPESLQIFRFTASPLQFTSLIFYRVQIREHLTRDQRPFLHPESLQIFRFTASSLQFTHSSSTGFRSENTWHEIRDHSFIQNLSRSSDSQLLLFSSLTHLLQGSDQRTPDTWSETIPSSRITPDLQIHSFFSSVHSCSTGFRSEEWMVIAEAWFCAQWSIFVLFLRFVFGLLYGWKIQTWPIIWFITESVPYWFCICWYLIESMMCLNKMSRTSSRNIGPQHQKYSSRFNCTHGVLFIPVFTKLILSVCC